MSASANPIDNAWRSGTSFRKVNGSTAIDRMAGGVDGDAAN